MLPCRLLAALALFLTAATAHAAGGELKPLDPTPAPALALPGLGGKPVDLAAFRGKVVLVNFWATYCKPCRDEMPSLDRLRARLAPRGFEVVGVDIAEDAATVNQFLAKVPVAFPLALDGDGGTMGKWKAIALPTSFLVDRQGRLRARLTGGADWEQADLAAKIETLLAEGGTK